MNTLQMRFKTVVWLLLFFLLVYGLMAENRLVPLVEINNPENIVVDQGQILITEFPRIHVYELKTLEYQFSFGQAGEGPKEFHQYVRIQQNPYIGDEIIVGSHMRMSYFTKKGEFIREVRSKSSNANVFKPLKDRFVSYSFYQDQEQKKVFATVELFDENLKNVKRLASWPRVFQQGRPFDPTDYDLAGGEFDAHYDRVFVLERRTGRIGIYSYEGKQIKAFTHNFYSRPVSVEDRRQIMAGLKSSPQFRNMAGNLDTLVEFPSHFPRTWTMIAANHQIHILTFENRDGRHAFESFDFDGNHIGKFWVEMSLQNPREPFPFTIENRVLYQLVENEDDDSWCLMAAPMVAE